MSFLGLRRVRRRPEEAPGGGGIDRTWFRLFSAETLLNPRPPPLDPAAGVDLAHEARFQLGRTEVRPATLELVRDGVSATVERKVMQALVVLARRAGEVTSRDELVEHVWSGRFIGEDAIHRVIAKLRQAAEGHCGGDFKLDTIPRVGYRLVVGGVRDAPQPGAARWRPGRRTWIAAVSVVGLLLAGVLAMRWWPQPAPSPPAMRLIALTALGPDVPAGLPASLADDIRTAFGKDNVVLLRERDPDFVLGGNVRRVGDKLQLTVRLENPRDGTMLWSGVREWPAVERVSPRFNAVNISQVIRCGLLDGGARGARLPDHALALYLQYCESRLSLVSGPARSVAIARRLVQEQPRFARGWSSLAWSAERLLAFDPKRADAPALRAEAKAAVGKALSLDPRDAQAYEVQAYELPETAYAARENLLRRASESRLTACGCEVMGYGGSLISVGRTREALLQYERAYQREPLGPHAFTLAMGYATLNDADRSDQAFAAWSEVFADTPSFLDLAFLRAVYAGRWSEAARLAALTARPQYRASLISAFEALASGDPVRIADARPALQRTAAAAPDAPLFASFYAVILAALDDRPAALDKLERTPDSDTGVLYHPAILAALRHEPRYLRLLERRGLIRYWRETRTRPDFCAAPDPPAFCKTLG